MELITKNNIDVWLFDYFEGNLQEEQKIQLLIFIKENPAYNVEMEQWAKTYIKEEISSDEEFVKSLKKPHFCNTKREYLGMVSILLVGIVTGWFLNDKLAPNTPSAKVDKLEIGSYVKKDANVYTATTQSEEYTKTTVRPKQRNWNEKKEAKHEMSVSNIETSNNSSIVETPIIISEIKKTEPTNEQLNNVQVEKPQIENTKPEMEESVPIKKKKKRSFDLMPSEEVIKTNPNF